MNEGKGKREIWKGWVLNTCQTVCVDEKGRLVNNYLFQYSLSPYTLYCSQHCLSLAPRATLDASAWQQKGPKFTAVLVCRVMYWGDIRAVVWD